MLEHLGNYASGRFCSPKCSRSYSTKKARNDINNKVSKKLLGRKLTDEHKRKILRVKSRTVSECLQCKSKMHLLPSDKRKFCSRNCWVSYTDSKKTQFDVYKEKCKFDFNVYDFPHKFNLSLIEEFGWYSASNSGNNLDGISRDHMLSIKEGFELGINPDIIKHPANCKLLRHSDNQRKNTKSTLSFEELILRINEW